MARGAGWSTCPRWPALVMTRATASGCGAPGTTEDDASRGDLTGIGFSHDARNLVTPWRSPNRPDQAAVPLAEVSSGISRLLTDNCLPRSAPPQRANTSLCKQKARVSSSLSATKHSALISGPASCSHGREYRANQKQNSQYYQGCKSHLSVGVSMLNIADGCASTRTAAIICRSAGRGHYRCEQVVTTVQVTADVRPRRHWGGMIYEGQLGSRAPAAAGGHYGWMTRHPPPSRGSTRRSTAGTSTHWVT
jgi:hypothetical protein